MDKVYYLDPGGLDISLFDSVVVETDQGLETAVVVIDPDLVMYSEVKGPFKLVLRKATQEDLKRGGLPGDVLRETHV
jgi:cell fate regulator YaaT (PSP1 superfamily)